MTPEVIAQLAVQFGLIPTLVIYLVYTDRKDRNEREARYIEDTKVEREKSQERERQLMNHIAKSDENMNKFADSLDKIGETLNGMDKSLNYLQKDVEGLKRGDNTR